MEQGDNGYLLKHKFYRKYGKRFIDVILSVTALLVLSVFLVVAAILVRVKHGKPVLFTQQRIGKDEKYFLMYKFRSMSNERDTYGQLLPDAQRMTKLGRVLRSTSIDELPALINIIKGDMSIIGPRPLPVLYQPYFKPEERIRHTVRGGLTGLAQINGRNNLSWENKFKYDAEYVRNMSFGYDAKIFFGTIGKVLLRRDVGVRGIQGAGDLNVLRKDMAEEEKLKIT